MRQKKYCSVIASNRPNAMHIVASSSITPPSRAQEHFAKAVDYYSSFGPHLSGICDLALGLYALSLQMQRIEAAMAER